MSGQANGMDTTEIRTQTDFDDGNTQTDEEVGQEVAPLVSPGDRHRGDVGDVVQATVDDEGRAANTETGRDVEAGRCTSSGQSCSKLCRKTARRLTDIAPYGSDVPCMLVPQYGIYEVDEVDGNNVAG